MLGGCRKGRPGDRGRVAPDAYWIDGTTIGYPRDRLPVGVDPSALRFRLHWGTLAVDATSLGGTSAAARIVDGAPGGVLALRLDRRTARRIDEIRAGPSVAIGVYDDVPRLVDATSVQP